jgi:hypothetical protein
VSIFVYYSCPLTAVGVYAAQRNFAEAALALVVGMLPVLTTDWNAKRFSVFVAAWVALGLGGLLVRSIAIATQSEKLFFHAVAACESYLGDHGAETLKRISEGLSYSGLGPIEKAEVLREFAFRKMPADRIPGALEACGQFSTLWEIDHRKAAVFVADIFRMFPDGSDTGASLKDQTYVLVRDSLVSPSEFLSAFAASKRLALSGMVNPVLYLVLLSAALHDGVPAEDIYSYIRETVERFMNEMEPEAKGV